MIKLCSSLFRKKNLENVLSLSANQGLKQELRLFDLLLLGLGVVIGSSIYGTTGQAIVKAGPGSLSIVCALLLAAFVCLLSALCFAELSSLVPVAGSVYTYLYVTMGEILAWLIGWLFLLHCTLVISAIVTFGVDIMQSWFNISFNFAITLGSVDLSINILPVLIIMVVTLLLSLGISSLKRVNNILVLLKIAAILLFIIVGSLFVQPANLEPVVPQLSDIAIAAPFLFFSFMGFDAVTSATEECKRPERDVPLALILILTIAVLLYTGVALVTVGVVPYQELINDPNNLLALVVDKTGFSWLGNTVTIIIFCTLMTGALGVGYVMTRLLYAISKDGLLPAIFSKVSSKSGVNLFGTWFSGIVTAIIVGFVPFTTLLEAATMSVLIILSVVALCVIFLRHRQPELKRPFRCPFFPVTPILCIGLNLYLMYNSEPFTWQVLSAWLVVGVVIYFIYSRRLSKLNVEH